VQSQLKVDMMHTVIICLKWRPTLYGDQHCGIQEPNRVHAFKEMWT